MFGFMVRGYFQQEFDLSEFQRACPLVCLSILDKLSNGKSDELDGLLKPECARKVIQSWEELNPEEKNAVQRSKAQDLKFMRPKLRMRMPDHGSGSELKAFLNIQIILLHLFRVPDWKARLPPGFSATLQNVPFPVQHIFEFEREVTRGVDGAWRLEDCESWPLPKFAAWFRSLTLRRCFLITFREFFWMQSDAAYWDRCVLIVLRWGEALYRHVLATWPSLVAQLEAPFEILLSFNIFVSYS